MKIEPIFSTRIYIMIGRKLNPRFAIAILMVLGAGMSFGSERNTFHIFTSPKVQNTRAQIMDIDLKERRVLLERDDQMTAWISINAFSKDDLDYISAWYDSHLLLNENALIISIEEKTHPAHSTKRKDIWYRKTPDQYVVTIENTSTETIDTLQIDYSIYIATNAEGQKGEQPRQESGTIVIGSLTNGQTCAVHTDMIVLHSEYTRQKEVDFFGASFTEVPIQAEQVVGAWFRVYGSSQKGVLAMREVCIPDDFLKRDQPGNSPLLSQKN